MKEVKYVQGDLMKFDGKTVKITYVGRDVIEYIPLGRRGSDKWRTSRKMIEPIPLTPEILGKNGWKKKVMSRGILNRHWVYTKPDIEEYGYFPIYIEKGIGKEFDVYPFTYNKSCTQITYIKYVHELQHLLFGLGINHEMEV